MAVDTVEKSDKKKSQGKIVRIDESVWNFIQTKMKGRETISSALRRLLGLPKRKGWGRSVGEIETKTYYVLPSELSISPAMARGRALQNSVRAKTKPEKPIEVREVI